MLLGNRHAAELDEIKRIKRKCMWARFQNTVTCFVDSCYVDGKFDDSIGEVICNRFGIYTRHIPDRIKYVGWRAPCLRAFRHDRNFMWAMFSTLAKIVGSIELAATM